MQNFQVFGLKSFFFFNTLLGILRQGVSSSICVVLAKINLDMITEKFLSPADLSRTQNLCIHKLLEVIIVGKHENFMLKAF